MSNRPTKRPLNLNKTGCSPTSSNCVTWQGPDIPCIGLCKGASVTEVVYEIGIAFCELYEQLDPANYNLDCLNLEGCAPETFQDLMQAVMCRVGELEVGATCNLSVSIALTTGKTGFTATATGGTGTLTWAWSRPDNNSSVTFVGATNQATATITYSGVSPARFGLIRVDVTDERGCVASAYFFATDN